MKKIMLLALALAAFVAFAAPSVASADYWYLDEELVGESTEEGVTFDGTGNLGVTRNIEGLGTVALGPCEVHVHGTVWNDPETDTGHGEVDSLEITTPEEAPCNVRLNGAEICKITGATSNFPEPWTIEVTPETEIDILGANFTDTFSEGCPLGAGTTAAGTATGSWNNGTSSIEFEEDGDLKTVPGEAPVLLDGSVELTPVEGGELTLGE